MEFINLVEDAELEELFQSMQIDSGEAHALFYALVEDDSDVIHIEEFIYGCLRLRGSVKAIDVFSLMKNIQTLHSDVRIIAERVGVGSASFIGRLTARNIERK